MIKKLMLILALVAVFATVANAQWTNDAEFASTVKEGSTQGIAVDPDGKIWASNYWADDTLDDGSSVHSIRVYEPDGSQASFSPIKMIASGGGFVLDTLLDKSYGIKAHIDGNILYCTSGGDMFKIDYKTGEGLGKVHVKDGSITMPDVSSDGTIYVASVAPGEPVRMYDADLAFVGTAIEGTQQKGYRRTIAVSSDGLTIYDIPFSEKIVYVFTRTDEFGAFALSDSIFAGWNIESCAWNKNSGLLWVSAGSEFDLPTATGVTAGTWYGVNMKSMEILDSLKWNYVDSVDLPSQRPRGIDFTSDGTTAYIGCFGAPSGYSQVQKLVKEATDVEQVGIGTPSDYNLSQNYPNPFNPTTMINFSIPESGLVTLKVYNVLGQEVAELVNDVKAAGTYEVSFDASSLTSGMYIYKIQSNNFSATRKMMLVK